MTRRLVNPVEKTGKLSDSSQMAVDLHHADPKAILDTKNADSASNPTHKRKQPPRACKEPARSSTIFPFMKLSAEVRNIVYKEVLVEPEAIYIGDGLRVYDHSPRTTCQLLQVSQAICREAFPVYFGCNTFRCNGIEALGEFLTRLKTEYRRSIRSLSFLFDSFTTPAKSIRLIQGCVSLRNLEITIPPRVLREYGTHEPDSLKWLPGLKDLRKVRGIENLKINMPPGTFEWDRFAEVADPQLFIKKLQIVKQPRSRFVIKRQDEKDFPEEKSKRTVFGKANVKTRSERAMAGDVDEEL
ncbi:MAG: hypothetical protein Q9169_006158 [Polycauliona sp. 2 TL-2023]